MRIYSNSFELMSEMGRELNSYGQTVKPKTYQNKVIEGNEDFITKELICQQYCLTSLGDPVWLFIFSHSKEWADAEFKERIGWYDLNPGKAWELRKDLWEQFLVNGKFDYTYPERIWNSLDIYGSTSFNCDSAMQSVIELLKRDNDTRKAVLPIFHGTDLRFLDGSKRIPCSMQYDFLIRQNGTEKEFSSFKVFFRSFKVLRPDLYEETYKSMKAKELLLEYEDIEYPENVISYSQRKAYKKKLLKQKNNGS